MYNMIWIIIRHTQNELDIKILPLPEKNNKKTAKYYQLTKPSIYFLVNKILFSSSPKVSLYDICIHKQTRRKEKQDFVFTSTIPGSIQMLLV